MNIWKILKRFMSGPEDLEQTLLITFHKDGRIRAVHNETDYRVRIGQGVGSVAIIMRGIPSDKDT